MIATIALIVILCAVLLLVSRALGQWPVFSKRLVVIFVASWLGYGMVRLAELYAPALLPAAGPMMAVGAIAGALFLLQPLKWGADDFLADLDSQMEAEASEVQP